MLAFQHGVTPHTRPLGEQVRSRPAKFTTWWMARPSGSSSLSVPVGVTVRSVGFHSRLVLLAVTERSGGNIAVAASTFASPWQEGVTHPLQAPRSPVCSHRQAGDVVCTSSLTRLFSVKDQFRAACPTPDHWADEPFLRPHSHHPTTFP